MVAHGTVGIRTNTLQAVVCVVMTSRMNDQSMPTPQAMTKRGVTADWERWPLGMYPFTRRGSWMLLRETGTDGSRDLTLDTVFLQADRKQGVFRIVLGGDGAGADFEAEHDGIELRVRGNGVEASACFPTPEVIRMRGRGGGAAFEQINQRHYFHGDALADGSVRTSSGERGTHLFTAIKGRVKLDSDYGPKTPVWAACGVTRCIVRVHPDESGEWEVAIEEWEAKPTGATGGATYIEALAGVRREFELFLTGQALPRSGIPGLHRLGCYNHWSVEVTPRMAYTRPGPIGSKDLFLNIYNWDSAFAALGIWPGDRGMGWTALTTVLHGQHASGMVPSPLAMNGFHYRFTNPPVQGWILGLMRKDGEISDEQAAEVYPLLAKSVDWWLTVRDNNRDGLPAYWHGNDSGWDNATIFDRTPTVTSPEISALLVLQLEQISELAARLGRPDEAEAHGLRAKELLGRMVGRLWNGESFVAVDERGEPVNGDGDCLLMRVPILLGKRLPEEIRVRIVADLAEEGRFLCKAGFATESLRSKYYHATGYWRGPVWPPPMMMICEGLSAIGETALAGEAARRFTDAIEEWGFHENFHAETGEGLCHPLLSWTPTAYRRLKAMI